MAYKIDVDSCTACGACESECPNNAISMKKGTYVIDESKCTECSGKKGPQCVGVCPSDSCVQA